MYSADNLAMIDVLKLKLENDMKKDLQAICIR